MDGVATENSIRTDMSRCAVEIEALRGQLQEAERALKAFKDNVGEA
jgi:hypothetical protein